MGGRASVPCQSQRSTPLAAGTHYQPSHTDRAGLRVPSLRAPPCGSSVCHVTEDPKARASRMKKGLRSPFQKRKPRQLRTGPR